MSFKKKSQKKIFLMGGVGNQLFQIARAYQYSLDGKNPCLLHLGKKKNLIYKLINFTNHDIWLNIEELSSSLDVTYREINNYDVFRLFIIFLKKKLGLDSYFDKEYFDLKGNILNTNLSKIDVGYFQTLNHVSKESLLTVADKTVQVLDINNEVEVSDFAVHIRGEKFQGARKETPSKLQPIDGLQISQYCKKEDLSYRIVTNDPDYVASIFPDFNEKSIYKGKSALDDFIFLLSSKNLFISNSTFTVWAALCSEHKNIESIFAPKDFLFEELFEVSKLSL
jgi:hypothetical protein